jgi:phosphate starvation-inducible PhoH-like protein
MENERKFPLSGVDQQALFGPHDGFIRRIEQACNISSLARDGDLVLTGQERDVEKGARILGELAGLIRRNRQITQADVQMVIDVTLSSAEPAEPLTPADTAPVLFAGKKGKIYPKTAGQTAYVEAVRKNDIVFSVGPAGTGKTYLAVAAALAGLHNKEISKIVLTRPAIEAGENLGFLPGDLMEKVDPYLRPLTDALFDMLAIDQMEKYFERKIIEIVPLAFMRGRTLNHAFVILDEAQNTSATQMKMFLTRLGSQSKAVVTGDVTQIDLPEDKESGLVQIRDVLRNINGIRFVELTKSDVVRHRLVKDIIQAYEDYHNRQEENP